MCESETAVWVVLCVRVRPTAEVVRLVKCHILYRSRWCLGCLNFMFAICLTGEQL